MPRPPSIPPQPPHDATAGAAPPAAGDASERREAVSAWFVSFAVHAAMLFLMGVMTLGVARRGAAPLQLSAATGDGGGAAANALDAAAWDVASDRQDGVSSNDAETSHAGTPSAVREIQDAGATKITRPPAWDRPTETPKLSNRSTVSAKESQNKKATADGFAPGGGLEGRGDRAGRIGPRGGTRQSEAAVERGLRWLAAHQRDDGSWSFDLTKPPCNGMCGNSGTEASATAATGLALLPFLGAGYTHQRGEHQEVVKRGLYYLNTRAVATPHGVDLRDGTMYGQAIATIALCEAYGMSGDTTLKDLARGSLRFIVWAQDLDGGGWRYTPGMAGDVTVTGWQLMALKSGQLARIEAPSPTIGLAKKFLDSVQFEGGARYHYMLSSPPRETQATTAVGLLCRMYTGWRRDNAALYRGIAHLHQWGPSKNNMYFNYYATQVLHHWEGGEWQAWNAKMRDYLVSTQSTTSHEAGSWFFDEQYGNAGGRLYNTAMAVMTLEVYYRYMPLYGQKAVHDRFR